MTDFIHAGTTIPYLVYLIVNWRMNTAELNYNSSVILILASPFLIQLKINLVLTSSIALDRLQALQWPLTYRFKRHCRYSLIALTIGIMWAAIDILIEFSLTSTVPTKGCAAFGCFVNDDFLSYWGVSNMVCCAAHLIMPFDAASCVVVFL
ncbi:hypothetical protein Tcan_07065 [Toxocara canis]|uniref:G_PROTEIN_RECEP_F1_2 domain-containing protein n=1 Tax=Toxocara canis TaxID=6265 RepID=A0A0B2W016_TOXCA|nr:hypothetical protein Tcan_07065 [Toxocara canis]